MTHPCQHIILRSALLTYTLFFLPVETHASQPLSSKTCQSLESEFLSLQIGIQEDELSPYGYQRFLEQEKWRVEPDRVWPATLYVVIQRMKRNSPIDVITASDDTAIKAQLTFSMGWINKFEKIAPPSPDSDPITLGSRLAGSTSQVYEMYFREQPFVFRPVSQHYDHGDSARVARRTWAAALLNAHMGLHTVPPAFLLKMHLQWGVVSEFITGKMPHVDFMNDDICTDTHVFEFLIGNSDAALYNARVDPSGHIVVFDHDKAFHPSVIDFVGAYARSLGSTLPTHYTAHFYEQLQALTPELLTELLQDHLAKHELAGIIYRREIILADIKLRRLFPTD